MRRRIVAAAALLVAGCALAPRTADLHEPCEALPPISAQQWRPDEPRSAAPFDDAGAFYRARPAFAPPSGYRASMPVAGGRLTLELYSRQHRDPAELARIVINPSDPGNSVWRLASPDHTDGVVLRTTRPLGPRYRVCARIGHLDYGSGEGANGYDGDERAGPWLDNTATDENGAYFGAIYRTVPIPQNNAAAHHERIVFIDSDNNTDRWTRIWDPIAGAFVHDGRHPVVLGAVPAEGGADGPNGRPFRSFAHGRWQPPGALAAIDSYLDGEWYRVCIARDGPRLTLQISGRFRFGGQTRYTAVIDNLNDLAHAREPHYWMLGDPHTNYYEGSLLVDEITIHEW